MVPKVKKNKNYHKKHNRYIIKIIITKNVYLLNNNVDDHMVKTGTKTKN